MAKIPKTITEFHVLQAIALLDRTGIPERSKPTKFAVRHNGNLYPPKLLVSKAHLFVDGTELPLRSFFGGKEGCNRLLIKLGFEVLDLHELSQELQVEVPPKADLFTYLKEKLQQAISQVVAPVIVSISQPIIQPGEDLYAISPTIEFFYTIAAGDLRSFMPDVRILLPASSWFNRANMRTPVVPAHVKVRAADSGGYWTAMSWGGKYPYSPEQYVQWLESWFPNWAAIMDLVCNEATWKQAQEFTTKMVVYFWEQFGACPWAWVPTIQGWEVQHYIAHATEMLPLIREMQEFYEHDPHWRVGIGSLAWRTPKAIKQIARAVASVLGEVPLHLWGVKLPFLQCPIAIPQQVVSLDSSAWTLTTGSKNRHKYYYPTREGMTQREWYYKIALPMYRDRLKTALNKDRQIPLLD